MGWDPLDSPSMGEVALPFVLVVVLFVLSVGIALLVVRK